MAAEDLTALSPPFITKAITLPGAGVARQVILPIWARRVSLRFIVSPGKYASSGVDDTAMVADHQTVGPALLHSLNVAHGARAGAGQVGASIFISGDFDATVVRLTIELGV